MSTEEKSEIRVSNDNVENTKTINTNNTNMSINVPKEKQILTQAISNIYVGLDKGTAKGVFTLKEAGQLNKDLELIAQVISQLLQMYERQN